MKFKKIFVFKSERTESGFDYSDNWKADDFVEIPDKLMEDAIVEDIKQTMKYFESDGVFCDCEILFNLSAINTE
jgi:hypothetical protein